MDLPFADRRDAGRRLADLLAPYDAGAAPKIQPPREGGGIVLGLPRGGVIVAAEVAARLGLPLDVLVVRKLGFPGHEELAIGAIAAGAGDDGDGRAMVLNEPLVREMGLTREVIEAVVARELKELERRERAFRGDRPPLDVRGRTVILVDDGLATGSTMLAAVRALKRMSPARVVVGVPVGAVDTCEGLRGEADEVVCATTPEPFSGVGRWYDDFTQTTDEEVHEALARGSGAAGKRGPGGEWAEHAGRTPPFRPHF